MPRSHLIIPKFKDDGTPNPEFTKPFHYGQTVERQEDDQTIEFRVTGIRDDGVYGVRTRGHK